MTSFGSKNNREGKRRKLNCSGTRTARGEVGGDPLDAPEAWELVGGWGNELASLNTRRREAGPRRD